MREYYFLTYKESIHSEIAHNTICDKHPLHYAEEYLKEFEQYIIILFFKEISEELYFEEFVMDDLNE